MRAEMPPTTRSSCFKTFYTPSGVKLIVRREDSTSGLEQAPKMGPPDASDRVPYIDMHAICRRMVKRSGRCSKTKQKAKTFSAVALKAAKSGEHAASVAWLLVVSEKYKESMTESELRHLYIALGTGQGLVEQWMMERGFDPLGEFMKPN